MISRVLVLYIVLLSVGWTAIISGYVRDIGTGKSIPNANVYIWETGEGAASNPYGYFELNLPKGNYTLQASVIGFETDNQELMVNNDDFSLEIKLKSAILEFNEVQVRGLFTTRLGFESVDVINSDNIKSMDKESVPDVLKNIPGVDVQFAHPNGRNVNLSIRGSSDYKPGGYNNRVLILLDGFPILIPNSGTPDWNSLPLESINRIEVENSPASTQYGHNSMGGVINLITDDGGNQKSTKFRLSSGSYSKGHTSIVHNNGKGNWKYGFNAMAQTSEGHRFNANNQLGRFRTYLRYGDQKGRTYRLSHILSYSDIGHPGFISSPSYRKSRRLSQYYQVHGFYSISKGISMSHSFFLNDFNTLYYHRDDSPEDYKDTVQTNYNDVTVGYRSEMLITKSARWIFMLGTDVDWSRSRVSVFNPLVEAPTQISLGGFIQSKYSIGNGWSLGSGIRYDYRMSDPGDNYEKPIYIHVSPKINLMYTMQHERAFTLAYSNGFRAPSLSELYLDYLTSYNLRHIGNPNLIPEKVQSIEMTYEHPHSKSWLWSVSLFHNRYKDMIDFVYGYKTKAFNREGVTAAGFEYQFKWEITNKIKLIGNYSYLDMTDRGGDLVLYRSKHRGRLNVHYQYSFINVQLGMNAWSKQIYEDFLCAKEEDENCKTESNNKMNFPIRELPERIILEIIISHSIESFKYAFHISNLLDTKYELIQDYPMPERNYKLTLTKIIIKEK